MTKATAMRGVRAIGFAAVVTLAGCGSSEPASSLQRCDRIAREGLADIAVVLTPNSDLDDFQAFIDSHLDWFDGGPGGIKLESQNTHVSARTVYLYLVEPADESAERSVRRELRRFAEVEEVEFGIRQEGGIAPGPVDCD
ncbi:MAG: hypothetical protein ACT4PI_14460 [Actinomycetota bacterium]